MFSKESPDHPHLSKTVKTRNLPGFNLPTPGEMLAEQVPGGNLGLMKYRSNLDQF